MTRLLAWLSSWCYFCHRETPTGAAANADRAALRSMSDPEVCRGAGV